MCMGGCGRVRSSSSPHWAEGAGQASWGWGWQERSSDQSDRSRASLSVYNNTTMYSMVEVYLKYTLTISIQVRSVNPPSCYCPAYGFARYEVASLTATPTFVQAWGNGVGVGVGVPQTFVG